MTTSMTIPKQSLAARTMTAALSVAAAVLLPQAFHAIGILSGTGAGLGTALLPMQLPVLFAGFLGGPLVGLLVGLCSPLLSFLLSGMPTAALLPFLMVELGGYGLVSGLLTHTKLAFGWQLLLTQLAGRLMRAAAILLTVWVIGSTTLTLAAIPTFVLQGLFGILLQWAVVPLLLPRLQTIWQRKA